MKDYIHKEYPKTLAPDDFFGQVKRTINGKPVSEEHIAMILRAIRSGLKFSKNDYLLDIACGNGALTKDLFPEFAKYLGVDFSEYLIEIAKKNFEKLPDFEFIVSDAAEYVTSEKEPARFTKALCYGAFAYFSSSMAATILKTVHDKFINVKKFYIGNIPDRDRAHLFYPKDKDFSDLLDNVDSSIGIWYSRNSMKDLAEKAGWKVEFYNMPQEFYSSHYRYDAILTRE